MTFNNRLNCTPCGNKHPKVKEDAAPKNSNCDKPKITSITIVKDSIIVTYDDCSYAKASVDVLDSNFCDDKAAISETAVEDLQERVKQLETLLEELKGKEAEIDTSNFTLKSDLIEITSLGGERFMAFPSNSGSDQT